jgi:hypothetical protein
MKVNNVHKHDKCVIDYLYCVSLLGQLFATAVSKSLSISSIFKTSFK